MNTGPTNLITDIATLRVGNSEDKNLKSGTTVIVGDSPFIAAVDVRGGAPGSRETDLLAPDKLVDTIDAIVLSGGSAFGLDAASGVMDALHQAGRGFAVGPVRVPIVSSAIIFDLLNGGDKQWHNNPYRNLGVLALQNAKTNFALGSAGAGAGATCSDLKGGLGSASLMTSNGYTVGALVVANPRGSVCVAGSKHFWAAPFEINGEFGDVGFLQHRPELLLHDPRLSDNPKANTTIAVVATDAKLTVAQSQRVAVAAHDGLARAIVPSHTPLDGDMVFSISTAQHELVSPISDQAEICHAASICLARAIAKGVYEASSAEGDLLPTWQEKWS